MTQPPPGWYPDAHGQQRWWDGQRWTDQTQQPPTQPARTQPAVDVSRPGEVRGVNGQVTFDGFFVTIYREGFRARASVGKGEKRIPLSSIAAVQWKPAGGMVNGFIQFTVPGGNERRSRAGRQTTDAVHDENSVVFTKAQMPGFEQLRAAVERAISTARQPAQSQAAPPVDIVKLAELHRAGVLTDAEFTAAKARALGL